MQMLRYLIIFSSIGLAAIGQIILKIGMSKNGELTFALLPMIKAFTNVYVLSGLVFYGVSLIIWLVVLSKENLSFVYPMVAFSYVVTTILARFFLHEEVPGLRWFGLTLIIFGIVCVARS
jgi:undecaprenyl phosphate-alpha-L-ara4N flippase subunit ArnE